MQYATIKGTKVPMLGFGTFELRGAEGTRAIRYALDLGYRHIDTAQRYENEKEVGEAMRTSGVAREDVFLTTKIWYTDLAYGTVQRLAQESLRRLGTDYVDLLLVHWPNPDIPLGETLKAFSEVQAKGQARRIGVSNFPTALMREAIEVHGADLFCNQVEYHPFLDQTRVLDYVRSQGMLLTAYLPVARGAVARSPVIDKIARAHAKTPYQVSLRWLLQQDGVSPIPRSSREENIRANFEVFDFVLSAQEMGEIDALRGDGRIVNLSWAPDWDPI